MIARALVPPVAALLLAAVWPGPAGLEGADAAELTVQQAVQSALANHPVLRQAQLDVDSAEARLKKARSPRLPQIDAGGLAKVGLAGSANLFALNGLAASPDPEGMAVSGNVFQEILDFKRSKFESEARRAEVEHFEETLRAERSTLVLNVKRAFYSALGATRDAALAEQRVKERELALREAGALRRSGLVPRLDVVTAEASLARARLELATAAQSVYGAMARLAEAMGEESARGYALEERPVSVALPGPFESLVAESLASRPELAALEARIRAAQAWVARAEREKYPRVMGLFSGGWTRFADLTLGRLLFGGFGIRLPLFTGGRLQASIEETRLGLEKARAVRDELLGAIPRQVAEARARLATAIEGIDSAGKSLRQARPAERLARARHRHGLASVLDLAAAGAALADAETGQARAGYDYRIAEAELDFATGRADRN